MVGLVASLGVGCSRKPAPAKAIDPARSVGSDATAREAVAITVYNQNFGVVRERRGVALGRGHVELSYADVAAHIQPETVHIRSLDDPSSLAVLEQNYRYDLLTPETLLEKSVGKTIKVYRYNEKLGTEEAKAAEVLAVEQGVVLRIDGQVTYDFQGRFAFPEVPPNLVAKPTLVWLLESTRPKQRVEVSYLTRGINWSADYVLVLDASDRIGDLTGWVTLANESGTSYEDAQLKLVAGDVQRVQPPPPVAPDSDLSYAPAPMAAGAPAFKEEGLFEYHLYALQRPTTIRDKEQKQVSLIEAHGVGVRKKLVFAGQQYFFRSSLPGPMPKQKVGVFLELKNEEKNRLGIPLPKGVLRVYKADGGGAQQFVGEDSIDHTPRDEEIRVRLGEAFDVVAERKQIRFSVLGECSSESEWQVQLRNHKDVPETVEVLEPVGGDWEVFAPSHQPQREDAGTLKFEVPVPAKGETTIRYRVRARWC
ncbi:MAG TPA: DUF4139 domain-containing protein [Polyangiaceae bacterium]